MDPLGLEEIVDGLVLEGVTAKFERFSKPGPLSIYSDKSLSKTLLLVFRMRTPLPYVGEAESYQIYQFFPTGSSIEFDIVSQSPSMPVQLVSKTKSSVVVTRWIGPKSDVFRLMLPSYSPEEMINQETGNIEWVVPSTHERFCNTPTIEKALDVLLSHINTENVNDNIKMVYATGPIISFISKDLFLANGFGYYIEHARS